MYDGVSLEKVLLKRINNLSYSYLRNHHQSSQASELVSQVSTAASFTVSNSFIVSSEAAESAGVEAELGVNFLLSTGKLRYQDEKQKSSEEPRFPRTIPHYVSCQQTNNAYN